MANSVRVTALQEAQLAAIVQSVKLAIITVDETQTIVSFNREAEAMFRCHAAQAIGGPLERFIPTRARAAHWRHMVDFAQASANSVRAMDGDRIVTGLRADGEEFPVDAVISCTECSGRVFYTAILRDVTQRTRIQEKMRFQSDIIDSSSDAIVSRRADGAILSWNRAAARMFGYEPEEVLGRDVSLLYSATVPSDQIGLGDRAMRGEAIIKRQTRRQRKDGSEVDVEVTISPVKRSDGSVAGVSAIYRDITERLRMEAELHHLLRVHRRAEAQARESQDRLRELSFALQTIREEEKARIARELHDELGQVLTALKMDVAAIEAELNLNPGSARESLVKRIDGMKQLIDTTVASVRRIAADLRPVMLDNLGLVPTLEWLIQTFTERSGIPVDLDIPDENLGVGGDAATAIFRIVQEALTNVSRHSGADHVGVEVLRRGGNVVARIVDNGGGFSEADTRKARAFGLLGMLERAHVLGGDLVVSSSAAEGTRIEAVIPAFGTGQREAS